MYEHVLAWREAIEQSGIRLPNWVIHRYIGMSDGLIVNALAREAGRSIRRDEAQRMQRVHGEAFHRSAGQVRALPGGHELLETLSRLRVPWAIATSGQPENAKRALEALGGIGEITLITRGDMKRAKPDPDLFLAAADRLGVATTQCVVVRDSVWDLLAARRARALGVGLLTGGYSDDELTRAGAYRAYHDPADLLLHLDEVGVRMES